MSYQHPLADFPKNTRDEVVNLLGEISSPAQHADSPKTVNDGRVSVTLTSGKRSMTIENNGVNDAFYGNSTVTSTNGKTLFAHGESVHFSNCRDGFTLFFITATGKTTTLRIIEF